MAPGTTEPSARPGLSPQERRARNSAEMREAIVEVATEIIREKGSAALTLQEVARRIGISTPALYTYFASKMDLYDALYRRGLRLFRLAEAELWRTTAPTWERLRAWFEVRLAVAEEYPEFYHLVFDDPIPGFIPTQESMQEVRQLTAAAVQGITEIIAAGVMQPPLPPEQVTDLLLTMRRGIVAEHMGKRRRVSPPDRFARLIPEVLAVLRAAWSPPATLSGSHEPMQQERVP
jgi:AcrR family transcriptional regulator